MYVSVKILEAESSREGFPPDSLVAFQQWVNARVLEVPEEYRDTAVIEWCVSDDYGDSTVSVCVRYRRPETVAEQEARIQTEQSRREAQLAREKLEYRRLRVKFEGPEAEPQAMRILREIDSQVIAQISGEFGAGQT